METKNKNYIHSSQKKIKAFTLVELIIVITILAILALIAFIGFQNFVRDSRDGNRLVTLTNIDTWLNLLQVQTWKYPTPDGNIQTWSLLLDETPFIYSHMWIIWDSISRIIKLSTTPIDPVSNSNYVYAVNEKQDKYQIATILENTQSNTFPTIPQTYASTPYTAKVIWNHQVNIKIPKDNKIWFVTIPSMIFTWNENTLNSSWSHHIINWGKNLPYTINNTFTTIQQNGDEVMQQIRDNLEAKIVTIDITNIIEEKNETLKKQKIEQTFWTWWTQEVFPWITSQELLISIWANPLSNEDSITQTVANIILWGNTTSAQPVPKLACEASTIDEYSILWVDHTSTYNAEKIITLPNGTQKYNQIFTCENWNFLKTWDEEIATPICSENYVASWNNCILDNCSGTRPEYSELNGTQWTANWSWSQSETGVCKYKCMDGYESLNCTPKTKQIISATHNSNQYTFTSFLLTYNSPETKTSQPINITNGTSQLTSTFTLGIDWESVILSNQTENIVCNTNYLLQNWNCVWKTYSVTLDKQWWSWGNQNVSAIYWSAMPSPWVIPTKSGCTFQWYFTAINAWTQYYSSSWTSVRNFNLDGDTTLYAQWQCSVPVSWYNWYPITVSWNSASIKTFMNHCQSIWKKLVHNYWVWGTNWNTSWSINVSNRYCSSTWWCTMSTTATIDRLAFASSTDGRWWPWYIYWIQYCPNWSTSCTNVATNDCAWWSRACNPSELDYVFQKAITPPSNVYIPCE